MNVQQFIIFLALPLAGYLLGSIPFAWIIGRANGVDLRHAGSKNIGASNLARVVGTKFFFYAFFLDAAKGFFPVLTAALLLPTLNHANPSPNLPAWSPLLTAAACVLGHLFPIWLKFRGGKGVATGFGAVVGFWPLFTIAGLLALGVFVTVLILYRYISLASMTAAISFAAFVALLGFYGNPLVETRTPWPQLEPQLIAAATFAALILLKHRGNIVRLIKGTEVTVGHREPKTK